MAAASDPRGYYAALGVDRTASAEDIKTAFRHRAKLLHPDGNAAAGDDEGFRRLVEAYEALRDPQHRVRYDAESLAYDRRGAEDRWDWEASAARSDTAEPSSLESSWPMPAWLEALVNRFGRGPLLAAGAALALLTMVAIATNRVDDRDRVIADLKHQLEAAQQRPAAVEATVQADAALPSIYRSELRFPARSTDLDAATRGRLDAVTAELRRAIAGLPPGSDWVVLVESAIARAADQGGLLVDAWELALLRVGVSAQYLVGHGIAAERVAVRFHAGVLAPPGRSDSVAFELLCCSGPDG